MKSLTAFAFILLLSTFGFTTFKKQTTEIPVRTVFVKDPAATDTKVYFSSITSLSFYVYKVGTKEDLSKIMSTFRNDKVVQNITEGAITGDYQLFTLNLKAAQNKEWFSKIFRKAGLNSIRINNEAIVPVEKL